MVVPAADTIGERCREEIPPGVVEGGPRLRESINLRVAGHACTSRGCRCRRGLLLHHPQAAMRRYACICCFDGDGISASATAINLLAPLQQISSLHAGGPLDLRQ